MKKIVPDANVIAHAFLEIGGDSQSTQKRDLAKGIIQKASVGDLELIAPYLLWYEVNGIFNKYQLGYATVIELFSFLFGFEREGILTMAPFSTAVVAQTHQLAQTKPKSGGHISAYDASYHALALQENATFVTDDKKHFDKTHDIFGNIELLEKFKV